jgi:hypothetical protein
MKNIIIHFILRLGVLSLCLAIITSCAKDTPNSLNKSSIRRITQRILTQEAQEINFFKTVCVESLANVTEVRKFFKDLEKKGLPSQDQTNTIGSKLSFSNNDYAVGVWQYKDLVTSVHYIITVTKQGKCKIAFHNKQLKQENLRKEFGSFAFATAHAFNGKEKRVTEKLSDNAPFTLEKYAIEKKNTDNIVIAVIIPHAANDLYEFIYQGSFTN